MRSKDVSLRILVTAMVTICIVASIASGATDVLARARLGVTPVINTSHFGYYGQENAETISYIQKNTPASSVFLTSSYANQFIPMTTGRAIYLGFEGWLWSQGRAETGSERKRKIREFLESKNSFGLCEDGVTHVYWDTAFKQEYAAYTQGLAYPPQTKEVYQDQTGVLYELMCEKRTSY